MNGIIISSCADIFHKKEQLGKSLQKVSYNLLVIME